MKQGTIDFSRAEQLGWLRDAKIPAGREVRSVTAKAVLNAIDEFCRGYGECFTSQDNLAKVANCGRRTLQRAVDHLAGLGLIHCGERKSRGQYGGATNCYTIDWDSVKAFSIDQQIDKLRAPTNAPSCPTNAPSCPTNAPSCPTNAPYWRTNRLEAPTETPTTELVEPDAMVVVEILNSSGLARAKCQELVNRHPITLDQADWIVRTYSLNQKLFQGPGAITWFIEHGVWPANRVTPAMTREQIQQRELEAHRNRTEHELIRLSRLKEDDRLAAVEAQFGPRFDAMDDDEQTAIAEQVLNDFQMKRWRAGKRDSLRLVVLEKGIK